MSEILSNRIKPKIIMNLPIQKNFMMGQKKSVEKNVVDSIVNDPELAKIISPLDSKDETVKGEEGLISRIRIKKEAVEIGTQMTDREAKCDCVNKKSICSDNQFNDDQLVASNSNTPLFNTKKIFDSVNESSFSNFKYTSPLFKACGLTSQVFKQRINFRVMKMNAFSMSKN